VIAGIAKLVDHPKRILTTDQSESTT
jgi:hypothetical protein